MNSQRAATYRERTLGDYLAGALFAFFILGSLAGSVLWIFQPEPLWRSFSRFPDWSWGAAYVIVMGSLPWLFSVFGRRGKPPESAPEAAQREEHNSETVLLDALLSVVLIFLVMWFKEHSGTIVERLTGFLAANLFLLFQVPFRKYLIRRAASR